MLNSKGMQNASRCDVVPLVLRGKAARAALRETEQRAGRNDIIKRVRRAHRPFCTNIGEKYKRGRYEKSFGDFGKPPKGDVTLKKFHLKFVILLDFFIKYVILYT